MIHVRRIAMSAVILSAALALGACGIGNLTNLGGGGSRPEAVNIPKAAGHVALSVPSLNSLVATTLTTDFHMRKVVVGEAPPGTANLAAFLAHPTMATASAVNTGMQPAGGDLWNVTAGIVQMPTGSSVSTERAMLVSLVRETIGTFSAKVQEQIRKSPTVYVDFAYAPAGIAYSIFWWGPVYQ